MTQVRDATSADLDAIVDMAEDRRTQYERYQPTFWRRAADSSSQTREFLGSLVGNDEKIFLVAEGERKGIVGFLLASSLKAPPVYDPGGNTFLIDDFCVREPELWSEVGDALLGRAAEIMKARGAVQVVVVCGNDDHPKASMLRTAGLSIASNWFTRRL